MYQNIISLNYNQSNDDSSMITDLLTENNNDAVITPLSMPECPTTRNYEMELIRTMRASLKWRCMSIQHIISIIIEYAKIGNFTFHDCRHITLPENIVKETETGLDYQQVNANEIVQNFSSFFSQKHQVGDILLFNNHRHGFIGFSNTIWLTTHKTSDDYSFHISIPKHITCQQRDAAYFYNIPYIIQHESAGIEYLMMELPSDDVWLRQQLEIPMNESLSTEWKYQVMLSRNSMMESVGDLIVVAQNERKSFKINGYSTLQHMIEYFKCASEPKITFKVRYIPQYGAGNRQKEKQNYKDLLPFTWDRQMAIMNNGIYRYNFTAPKSQITQQNISNVGAFIEPFMKQLTHNSCEAYVVVSVIVVYKWGDKEDYKHNDYKAMTDCRTLFEQRLHEIFDGYYGNWKKSFGDFATREKYADARCDIYYGPKCELNHKIEELHFFMKSQQHKEMEPWIKMEKFEVQDALSEIHGIEY